MKKKIIFVFLFFTTIFTFARSVPYEYKGGLTQSLKSTSIKPKAESGIFVIWDFNQGLQNTLGGWGNPFTSGQANVEMNFSSEVKRGKAGRSLELIGARNSKNYCGYWFHFFDMKKTQKQYLNISDYGYLSFFVKGTSGGEDFLIKVADEKWVKREDSVPVGKVSDYIKGGTISARQWREVVVPISDFKIDIKRFAGITFEFSQVGKTKIYIDDIILKDKLNRTVPVFGNSFVPKKQIAINKELNRALWVWHPTDYENPTNQKELIQFCKQKGINVLWVQVLTRMYQKTENGLIEISEDDLMKANGKMDVVLKLEHPELDRKFLKYAHTQGIKEVHALDGYKKYVLTPMHPKMLAEVQMIIDFNKEAKDKTEMWDGVHHDNELYLLDDFKKESKKEYLFKQYFDLASSIMALIKSNHSNLQYGCDIPFWFDEPDESLHFAGMATYNGVTKPADYHLLDIVDNIGIMDYRNFAYGPDGTITHGEDEMKYANKVGKKVYVGIETIKLEPAKITFYGKSEEYLNKVMRQTEDYFKKYRSFSGMAIHYYRTYKALCEKK